jgi:hypothetical protein
LYRVIGFRLIVAKNVERTSSTCPEVPPPLFPVLDNIDYRADALVNTAFREEASLRLREQVWLLYENVANPLGQESGSDFADLREQGNRAHAIRAARKGAVGLHLGYHCDPPMLQGVRLKPQLQAETHNAGQDLQAGAVIVRGNELPEVNIQPVVARGFTPCTAPYYCSQLGGGWRVTDAGEYLPGDSLSPPGVDPVPPEGSGRAGTSIR